VRSIFSQSVEANRRSTVARRIEKSR